MKNKRFTSIVAIILVLVMVFSLILVAIDALTPARAYVTQAEIDRLRDEKKDFERRKQEIQSEINAIEYTKLTEVAKKSVLDSRIIITGMEIDNIKDIIATYVVLIAEKEIDLYNALQQENEQLSKYKSRVRDMEENGVITYLEIIFDSAGFSDLLARIDFVGDIMKADETIYRNLIIARAKTEAVKADLEMTKEEMEAEHVSLSIKYAELEEQVEEANKIIQILESDLATAKALYEEEAAEAQRLQDEINKKQEELRAQEAAALALRVRGTGQLMWPVPSNGNVASQFGTRLHPVYGVYMTHFGIDIPADYGEKVIASDSGTVIVSEYNSSYGNYVVISHGDIPGTGYMTTLYAHLSSRSVSYGDTVTKGQTIGYIGSTGVSTGPHLHYEVSVNGERRDPEKYL